MLDKKPRSYQRRGEEEEAPLEENYYLMPLKSVLLARLDEAMTTENETPSYKALRHMVVAAELSKLDPAHFYRQVRVVLPCNIRREGRAIPCNWRVIPCNIRRKGV